MYTPDAPCPEESTRRSPAESLSRLLTERFKEHEGRVAVRVPGGSIDYATLDRRSAALANALRSTVNGAEPRTVAVEADRSIGFVIAVVAVIRSGLRLMTVDQNLPADHLSRMRALGDPACSIRVGGQEQDTLPALTIDRGGRLPHEEDPTPPDADDGGYLFFTSGTTGAPKAVVGRFDTAAHFVRWQSETFGVTPDARFAQLTAPTFDVFLRDLLTPLASGAAVCLPPRGLATGDPAVLDWMNGERVTHLHTVPSVAANWLGHTHTGTGLPHLERTFFAGEPLGRGLVEHWRALAPNSGVVNLYGPTETTLAKFAYEVPGRLDHDPLPVGRPLPGAELVLLDEAGGTVTDGHAGEVVIRTALQSRGYLGATPEEEARFTPGPTPGTVDYRTGDVGHLDGDGLLHLAGRVDRQVKIDGNRVEPDGSAALLGGHPDVVRAVVEVRERDGRPFLEGFYTSRNGLPAEELRAWALRQATGAHVPATLARLDDIPLTPNGKIDLDRLPTQPEHDGPVPSRTGPTAPESGDDLLDRIVAVFADVLGEPVGADDDFLRWGGSSISAAGLSAEVTRITELPVEYADVFEYRTPRRLTAALRGRAARPFDPIPESEPRDSYPLSPQQRRYLRVYLPEGNRSWANMTAVFDGLPDGVGTDQVGRALVSVLSRHDGLLARFEKGGDGILRQVYAPVPDRFEVTELPLSGTTLEEEEAEVARLAAEEAAAPVPVDTWPLFRVTLLVGSFGRRRILWKVHHLVSDGQSQRLLGEELRVLLEKGESSLPPVMTRYRDYAIWRSERERTAMTAQRDHWQDVFAEPFDRPLLPEAGTPGAGASGRAFQLPIGKDLSRRLHAFALEHGLTPFSVVLAAYMLACHDRYGRSDMVVGTPAAGRGRSDTDSMIGNFISLVLMRHRKGETRGFAELAALLQQRTALAMTHQDLQYDEVMNIAEAAPDGDRFPLTTAFISQVEVLPGADPAALESRGHRSLGCEVKFDMMAYVKRSGERLAVDLQYRAALLTDAAAEETLIRLRDHLERGLRSPEGAERTH